MYMYVIVEDQVEIILLINTESGVKTHYICYKNGKCHPRGGARGKSIVV